MAADPELVTELVKPELVTVPGQFGLDGGNPRQYDRLGNEELCGEEISMVNSGIYTAVIEYYGDVENNCSLSIIPWPEWNKLLFQITRHSNGGNSCLSFAQGENGTMDIPGLDGEYCGHVQPPKNRQFFVEKLYINYKPHTSRFNIPQVFEIVITVFREEGQCADYQCNNKRCIPHNLRCTDYNPCGDSSDCPSNRSNFVAIGKVVGIIVGVAVGVVVLMIVIRRCMAAAGKESDAWDSEPRLPSEDGERTPSLHDSDWQSYTRDGDRFWANSIDDSDWLSDIRNVGRSNDDISINSAESLEIEPFYTDDGRQRCPIYDSMGGTNGHQNNQSDPTALTNVSPSASALNNIHSGPFSENEIHDRTEDIEMSPIVVHESEFNSGEILDNTTIQRDYELPPPSYESVMGNEKYLPQNS